MSAKSPKPAFVFLRHLRSTYPGVLRFMDYVVGAITLAAMELIARHRWQGWALGLVNQALWLILCWQRELWGLILLPVIFSWRYAVALRRWRQETRTVAAPAYAPPPA